MKRALSILSVLLLATAAPLDAQGFGFAGGINLANFFGDDVGESGNRSGLVLGLTKPLYRAGRFQLRAEGYYRQKGARDVAEFQSLVAEGQSAEFGIDYFEVPLLLRVELPGFGGRVFPYVQAGPAFAWKIDCGMTVGPTIGAPDGASSRSARTACDDLSGENVEETIKNFERGLLFGGGLELPVLGVGAITLDGRYTHGLSRLAGDGDIYNRALSLMLGYSFSMPVGMGRRPGSGLPGVASGL